MEIGRILITEAVSISGHERMGNRLLNTYLCIILLKSIQ